MTFSALNLRPVVLKLLREGLAKIVRPRATPQPVESAFGGFLRGRGWGAAVSGTLWHSHPLSPAPLPTRPHTRLHPHLEGLTPTLPGTYGCHCPRRRSDTHTPPPTTQFAGQNEHAGPRSRIMKNFKQNIKQRPGLPCVTAQVTHPRSQPCRTSCHTSWDPPG